MPVFALPGGGLIGRGPLVVSSTDLGVIEDPPGDHAFFSGATPAGPVNSFN